MIRETLENLPEGLGETYEGILIKINRSPSRAKMAQKLFKWVTVAKRPLHVEELKEAVAFEPNDQSWNLDKIPHEDLMFESCRGLIIKDEDDETAHFAHHTVRQYLTGRLTTVVDQFGTWIESAENLAGQTCIAYLSFSDFETQITSTRSTVRLEQKGVLESGGPLWIPSILGIRKPMFDVPYRLLRGDPALRPSESDYWKHIVPKPKPKTSPSTHLLSKYRLLSYTVENWELHMRSYSSSKFFSHPHLVRLIMHKTLAFEFRPWGPNQHFGSYGCVGCPSPSSLDLVAQDLPHISMIHYAAEVGNSSLLFYGLPGQEGYIHHERYHQETLMIACRHNRVQIVEYLMTQGEYDISDGRAVNAAATAGHAAMLQYLLTLGQYSVEQQGDVALFLATKNGHDAIITVLAEAGVDLDARDQRTGMSVIEIAAMNGHESAIRVLLKNGAFLQHTSSAETSALHLAAARGHPGAIRVLLEFGFPANNYDSQGETALHHAAMLGYENVAEVLLEFGANPSLRIISVHGRVSGRYGVTPFDLAAKGGHFKVLEVFRSYVPSEKYLLASSEQNALHLAAAGGHVEAIRWLVEYGLDVNVLDSMGQTPLFLAVKLGDKAAVGVLLELKANVAPAYLDNYSYNTLTMAVEGETTSILEMLVERIQVEETLYSYKRSVIVTALSFARKRKKVAAEELLVRELKRYPNPYSSDSL